jgi:hypothetical protein
MCHPFVFSEVRDVATEIKTLFSLDSCLVEKEYLLQSNLQLKAQSSETGFWNMMRNKLQTNVRRMPFFLTPIFNPLSCVNPPS